MNQNQLLTVTLVAGAENIDLQIVAGLQES
jgi:hypothetical protein